MTHLLFLSHAGIDSQAALTLAERIENSPDAQRAGLRVFIDKIALRAGGRWKDQLQQALRNSTAFAVYVGSKGVVNWVSDEVSVALDRAHSDHAYPVIPVLSAAADLTELPSFLSQYQSVTDVEKRPEQFEQLLRGILRVEARAQVAAEPEPFVGLEAFDTRKAHLFFGREQELDELVTLLRDEPLIMVVGDSGSGKSSIVKASLVPAFRGGRLSRPRSQGPDDTLWYVVETRPGTDPFGRLADDLRKAAEAAGKGPRAANEVAELVRDKKPSKVRDALLSTAPTEPRLETKALLVVDQFEELRTSPDAVTYAETLASLAPEGDDTIRVVLTMRRDFYYLCNSFPVLYERLERNNRRARYHLHRISRERLPKCVTEPLRLAGIASPLRTMLADAVTKDAGDEPGELALLQMALWRTWARRSEYSGDLLRSYQAIGRIEGAIAHHAGEVFTSLTNEEKQRAEGLFLRLVRPGEAGGVTRRTATLDEFDPQTQSLAKKLGGEQYRLLNLGEDTVEITHEALATQWQQYQQWISNSPADPRGDDLRTLQSLIADATGWAQAEDKNKKEHLARGYDLSLDRDLATRRPSWIAGSERAYIDASGRAAVTAARTKQIAIAALVILTFIASAFGYYAGNQRNLADAELKRALSAEAETNRQKERSQFTESGLLARVSAEQIGEDDPGSALLLALEALPDNKANVQRRYSPETEVQAGSALRANPERAVLAGHKDAVFMSAFSPDGSQVVTASDDKTARLWNAETGKELALLSGHKGKVLLVAFSPKGHRIMTASDDGTALLWDSETGRRIGVLSGHAEAVLAVSFSPDGLKLLTGSSDGTARLWKAGDNLLDKDRPIAVLSGHASSVRSAAFSSDGSQVVTASDDKTVRLWDPNSGDQIRVLKGHSKSVYSAELSPNGHTVVSASEDKTARLWDLALEKEVTVLRHRGSVQRAVFNPDEHRVVTASDDSTVLLWDVESGKVISTWKGHTDRVLSAAFSRDGRRVVTASADRTARVWDIDSGKEVMVLKGHTNWVRSAAFSNDGSRVVTASSDKTARIWDAEVGKEIAVLKGHDDWVYSAEFSPDDHRVVTASGDNTARLWDVRTEKELAVLNGHTGAVRSAAFNKDGRRVVTASSDKTVRVWDAEKGEEINVLYGHTDRVVSAAFSSDANRVLTASYDGTARLWDLTRGKDIAVLAGHTNWVQGAAFSPTGNRVVTASEDRTARIWHVFSTTQALVDYAKESIPRCLTQAQRARFFLSPEPPRWCITGAGHEFEEPSRWEAKWPYQASPWQTWLIATDKAQEKGETPPPVPKSPQ
jgi:WD40 repeat protein